MPRYQIALPVPPLEEGVVWTGQSLLNYVLSNLSTHEEKLALFHMKATLGPERFRSVFEEKATELNRRFAARTFDSVVDDVAPLIVSPGKGVN